MVKPSEKENEMKEFKTISEVELLNAAYMHILEKWVKKGELQRDAIRCDLPHQIIDFWVTKYKLQLDELHEAILELEKEQQK